MKLKLKLPLIALCLASLTPSLALAELTVEVSFSASKHSRRPRPPRLVEVPVLRDNLPAMFSDPDVCFEHVLQGSADSTSQFLDIEGDYSDWHRANAAARVLICDEGDRTASFD